VVYREKESARENGGRRSSRKDMATMNVGVGEGDNGEAGDGRDVIERGILWAGEKRGRAHVVWWRRVMKTTTG
jgi:hypothetical protein